MNSILNFSKQFAIPAVFMLAVNFNAYAQSPVESTHIDEKYAYTTVVYKATAASDKDVLTSLENDFGIGDVVRVTLAPPPAPISAIAASEPVYADKSKGEDAWLPASKKSTGSLTTSIKPSVDQKVLVKNIAVAPEPATMPAKAATAKMVVAPKTVVPEGPKQVKAAVVVADTKVAPTTLNSNTGTVVKAKVAASGKSVKAHKSTKKSSKKGSYKKLKNRKHGKQRYACPKF